MKSLSAWGLLLLLALGGCGSKDIVSLSASVGNVKLAVEDKPLGPVLSGSFELFLEVGSEADGSDVVEPQSFALVKAADQAPLVPALDAVPQGASFPMTIGKGSSKTVSYQLDTTKTLQTGKADLCAGQVQVIGTVESSLNGGETISFRSGPVSVSGC